MNCTLSSSYTEQKKKEEEKKERAFHCRHLFFVINHSHACSRPKKPHLHCLQLVFFVVVALFLTQANATTQNKPMRANASTFNLFKHNIYVCSYPLLLIQEVIDARHCIVPTASLFNVRPRRDTYPRCGLYLHAGKTRFTPRWYVKDCSLSITYFFFPLISLNPSYAQNVALFRKARGIA